ncbi:hypothetical protein BJ508DRAFT_304955 [Ascobolus immersus RN42]|uniref:Uncharacterized protein n=1 Tax=Ascobolus immersus RN42 TaxID=1160509 RepID=A0A3N4IEV0_ASCIM|nr:hypothetical protein BJ508DRAFT_304955 [Ascobolus immersus RN42]
MDSNRRQKDESESSTAWWIYAIRYPVSNQHHSTVFARHAYDQHRFGPGRNEQEGWGFDDIDGESNTQLAEGNPKIRKKTYQRHRSRRRKPRDQIHRDRNRTSTDAHSNEKEWRKRIEEGMEDVLRRREATTRKSETLTLSHIPSQTKPTPPFPPEPHGALAGPPRKSPLLEEALEEEENPPTRKSETLSLSKNPPKTEPTPSDPLWPGSPPQDPTSRLRRPPRT